MSKNFFELQRFTEKISLTAGDDNYRNRDSDKIIYALGGDDTVDNGGSLVTIYGGSGKDSIWSGFSANVNKVMLQGGDGDDYVRNSYGDYVTLSGGAGDDSVLNDSATHALLLGDAGNDWINNAASLVSASGGAGNDLINNFSTSYVSLSGGAGDDTITAIYASNYLTIDGGAGNDLITMPSGSYGIKNTVQYIYGDGNDTVIGFNGDDTLQITTPKSFSTVRSDNDLLIKFDNNQTITLKNAPSDLSKKNFVTIKGGGSSDTLPAGLTLNAAGTIMTASKKFTGSSIDLTNYAKVKILNATALTKKVTLTGNSLDNTIQGGSKNDKIYGGYGNDFLRGNAGNDVIYGGAGKDTLIGGNGNDTLDGGAGNDSLIGGAGADSLNGGVGDDYLSGDAGNDKILGGKGNDTLTGGAGNDTLTGGAGNDVFVYSKGKDVITDYKAGEDTIYLEDGVNIKSWKVRGKNVIFTTNTGTLNVKNGKGKRITISQNYSNSSSNVAALLNENNFVTSDNLSAIVQNNFAATDEIQTQDFDTLTQKNNLITFAEK